MNQIIENEDTLISDIAEYFSNFNPTIGCNAEYIDNIDIIDTSGFSWIDDELNSQVNNFHVTQEKLNYISLESTITETISQTIANHKDILEQVIEPITLSIDDQLNWIDDSINPISVPTNTKKRRMFKEKAKTKKQAVLKKRCTSFPILYINNEAIYWCKDCNMGFDKIRVFELHLRNEHPDQLHNNICDICGNGYIYRTHLLRHHREQHGVRSKRKNIMVYYCQLCKKEFKRKEHLTKHQREVHDNVRDFLCQFCQKAFIRKFHLLRHQKLCQNRNK